MGGSQDAQRSTPLNASLQLLPGVGPKVLTKLRKLGLITLEDALFHLPARYEDRRRFKTVSQLVPGRQQIFIATVLATGESVTSIKRKRIYEIIVGDDTGKISLKWFRYYKNWLKKRFPIGQKAIFIGEVKQFSTGREIHHPESELIGADADERQLRDSDPLNFGRILPVYPLTEGLSQKQMRKIWFALVGTYGEKIQETLPEQVQEKYHLLERSAAFRQVHWPEDETDMKALLNGRNRARDTLVFDEFFYLELGLALKRAGVRLEQGTAFCFKHKYTIPLNKMLPFRLTEAQKRVLGEIKRDMLAPHPMHRLLQGDVGSGKTLVALMAGLIAIENRYQVAVVAPTEILAEQHFRTFEKWLSKLDLNAALLTGGMSAKHKRETYLAISRGDIDLIVGTHAVLQEGVEFHRLGLGIIDEQHRFGVQQRALLKHKGVNPDILVMTATPIPRTLSMTLYGDLSVSVIDQLPPGRHPVKTYCYRSGQNQQLYALIRREINAGRQAYIVYPLVEESEKIDLKAATEAAGIYAAEIFPEFTVALLHGRLKAEEKEQIMQRFRAGEIQLLVATTVIEVGVDVPNATLMAIEHADRFGLSQLHQLRGRVGRGTDKSYCILVPSENISDDARKRLKVMTETEDGFRIAEADLEIRGPGDFLGTRQAGLPDLRIANLVKDLSLLETARREAFEFVKATNQLKTPAAASVKLELQRRWGGRLELAGIG